MPDVNHRALSTARSGELCGSAGSGIPIFCGVPFAGRLWDHRTNHPPPRQPFAGLAVLGDWAVRTGARAPDTSSGHCPLRARARPRPTPSRPPPGSVDRAPGAAHAPSSSRDPGSRAPRASSPPGGRARWLPLPLPLAAAAVAAGIVFVVAEAGRAAGAGSLSPGRAPPPPPAQRPRLRGAPPQRQYSGDQALRGGGGGGGARSGRRRGPGRGGPRRRHGGAGTR